MTEPLTFAIITDTHVRAPGGDQSSPFPVNDKADARARYAVGLIAAEARTLTIHLGDIVHVLPHMPEYADAAAEAMRILEPLGPNLHFVPGNHDIGDKPSPGMPAKAATPESLATYQSVFGSGWQHIDHGRVHFVLINSSLVNSGLAAEQEQASWLETKLAALDRQRIFLFSHYPPFIISPDEQDHYDNYAEPGRSWLLDLAARHGVEAIFSGHVHHFFFNSYRGIKLYCLPPTSFTRQDYAEMFPDTPANEYGRDDAGKFSVAFIDVDADGHRLRVQPTYGREAKAGDSIVPPALIPQFPSLIPHLRHAWFEARSLPYNGPMEEFTRKRVRNDYPLLRLLQLGIKSVRTPVSDMIDTDARARVADWASLGMRFVVFKIGALTSHERSAILDLGDVIHAVELIATQSNLAHLLGDAQELIDTLPSPIWISRITTFADMQGQAGPFAHTVSTGFLAHHIPEVCTVLPRHFDRQLPGVVFQIPWGENVGDVIGSCARSIATIGAQPVANLRLAAVNPAIANFDDVAIGQTLRAASEAAARNGAFLQCDTFEDVDRGYHPRHGLIDRHANLRLHVLTDAV